MAKGDSQPHCLVIGGGPAGLTAAIYLARFDLSITIIDGGQSRARTIAMTHNHAGFPGGISGTELVDRMKAQARLYGAQFVAGTVEQLARREAAFDVQCGEQLLHADAVLLATGVINHRPEIADDVHDAALAAGLLRYCPICDGYEVRDKRIAVLGSGKRGAKEALFLRSYSADITLISPDGRAEACSLDAELASAGITRIAGPCCRIALDDGRIILTLPDGPIAFDTLYPALGSVARSELGSGLGAQCTAEGCLIVDPHQRTTVPGLYAAGDVVLGLDQISHAMGEGGVAATTIRNDLAERTTLWRQSHFPRSPEQNRLAPAGNPPSRGQADGDENRI